MVSLEFMFFLWRLTFLTFKNNLSNLCIYASNWFWSEQFVTLQVCLSGMTHRWDWFQHVTLKIALSDPLPLEGGDLWSLTFSTSRNTVELSHPPDANNRWTWRVTQFKWDYIWKSLSWSINTRESTPWFLVKMASGYTSMYVAEGHHAPHGTEDVPITYMWPIWIDKPNHLNHMMKIRMAHHVDIDSCIEECCPQIDVWAWL